MIWQDIVISMGTLIFGFVLIPMLRDCIKGKSVNLYTSGLTALILYIFAGTFYTLGLYATVAMNLFTSTTWLSIFIFSWRNRK